MIMKKSILAATLVVLAACGPRVDDKPTTPTDAGASPSVTLVGDTAFLELPLGRSADNGELQVTFDTVTEDSRCPRDVQCVWEGNAGIRLTVAIGNETEVAVLNSALNPRQAAFLGYTIGFRDLTPYPVSTEPRDLSEYVATIAVVDTR